MALGQGHDPSPSVTLSPQGGLEGAGGAVQRQAGSGRGVLVTERGAARWNGLPACRPLILAPCCRDHVLPARRPNSCSPHFDNDEKQKPSLVPTYRCWHCRSPPGCTSHPAPPAPPEQGGIDGAQPHMEPHHPLAPLCSQAGGTSEPLGLCVGRAALREMLLNFMPFDASCLPCLLAQGLTPDPPSCWTPLAPPRAAHKC